MILRGIFIRMNLCNVSMKLMITPERVLEWVTVFKCMNKESIISAQFINYCHLQYCVALASSKLMFELARFEHVRLLNVCLCFTLCVVLDSCQCFNSISKFALQNIRTKRRVQLIKDALVSVSGFLPFFQDGKSCFFVCFSRRFNTLYKYFIDVFSKTLYLKYYFIFVI